MKDAWRKDWESIKSGRLISTKELAKILNIGVSTIEQGRITGSFPIGFIRIGRTIRYRVDDVEKFLSSHRTYKSTSEADEDM